MYSIPFLHQIVKGKRWQLKMLHFNPTDKTSPSSIFVETVNLFRSLAIFYLHVRHFFHSHHVYIHTLTYMPKFCNVSLHLIASSFFMLGLEERNVTQGNLRSELILALFLLNKQKSRHVMVTQ